MADGLQITTNNVPRLLLDWAELTDRERRDFDWIENPDESGESFFRYRGAVYCLSEFMRTPADSGLEDWDGYHSETYFSGILVRHVREDWGAIDRDRVICGRYFA